MGDVLQDAEAGTVITAFCYDPKCKRDGRPWIRHADARPDGRVRCPTCHSSKVNLTGSGDPVGLLNGQGSTVDKLPRIGRRGEDGGNTGKLSVGADPSAPNKARFKGVLRPTCAPDGVAVMEGNVRVQFAPGFIRTIRISRWEKRRGVERVK